MRTLLVSFLLLLITQQLSAQNTYHLTFQLTGFEEGTVLYLINLDDGNTFDSIKLQNKPFIRKGTLKALQQGIVFCRAQTADGHSMEFYLENKPIVIKGSKKEFRYARTTGTETNDCFTKLKDGQLQWQKERDSLVSIIVTLPESDSAKTAALWQRVSEIDKAMLQYRVSFIRTEKPTFCTIQDLFLLRSLVPLDTLKVLYTHFTPVLQQTRDGEAVAQYIRYEKPDTGKHYIDISCPDSSGSIQQLSAIKRKYILLEFWASWCGPCRQENPQMIATWRKYADKGFEIYAVSSDTQKSEWLKAMNNDHLPWINVSDLKGFYGSAISDYKVSGLPHNYLIGPDGVIVAKNLRGHALEAKLEELMK